MNHMPASNRLTQSGRDRTRFLTGGGRYVADTVEAAALHAAFVRSPHAHARILSIDISSAAALPGVVRILTGADCTAAGLQPFRAALRYKQADGSGLIVPHRPVLADGVVRFAGETVACVVATSAAAAQDAAEAIMVEYADLPAAPTLAAAFAPAAPLVHPQAPGNVAFDFTIGDGPEVTAALAGAAHVVEVTSALPRLAPSPMEPRGGLAWYEADTGVFHLRCPHQGVNELRGDLCTIFGVPPERMMIELPDVGGGFGARANAYPEQPAILLAAKLCGRPVQWAGTRTETFVTDHHGRGTRLHGRLALDADGRFLALDVLYEAELGAYITTVGAHVNVHNPLQTLTGTYAIPAARGRFRLCFTHAGPTGPYRGAGRPDIALLIERLVDAAAAATGLDPLDIRARNAIPADLFPYVTRFGVTYDSADYPALIDAARDAADWAGFAARAEAARKRGRLLGRGVALFTEIAGGGMVDRDEARITLHIESGRVAAVIETVTGGSGQSHAETYAFIAAAQLGIDPADITLDASRPDSTLVGVGSIASRGTISVGSAVRDAALMLRTALLRPAALRANCAPEDLHLRDGLIVDASGETLGTVADALAAQGGTLDALGSQKLSFAFPSGCHVAEIELDPDTGESWCVAYTAVDDAGTIINHAVAEGQIHGGIAQGLGEVFGEAMVYDADGQPLTASFMDYRMPRAADLPMFALHDRPTASPHNPLGAKGLGEAGTTGALAAAANALAHALGQAGAALPPLPCTPLAVWTALQRA